MSRLPENLRFSRKNKKASQKELANLLGVTERTLRRYESGGCEPNVDGLIALADFFDVSIDYLVGRSDDPTRR